MNNGSYVVYEVARSEGDAKCVEDSTDDDHGVQLDSIMEEDVEADAAEDQTELTDQHAGPPL